MEKYLYKDIELKELFYDSSAEEHKEIDKIKRKYIKKGWEFVAYSESLSTLTFKLDLEQHRGTFLYFKEKTKSIYKKIKFVFFILIGLSIVLQILFFFMN